MSKQKKSNFTLRPKTKFFYYQTELMRSIANYKHIVIPLPFLLVFSSLFIFLVVDVTYQIQHEKQISCTVSNVETQEHCTCYNETVVLVKHKKMSIEFSTKKNKYKSNETLECYIDNYNNLVIGSPKLPWAIIFLLCILGIGIVCISALLFWSVKYKITRELDDLANLDRKM